MKPKEQRGGGQGDLFRARLDQIISLQHALVKLAGEIDWPFLEHSFGAVYTDAPGRPPTAHAADGGARDPQIQLQPLGRAALRGLA